MNDLFSSLFGNLGGLFNFQPAAPAQPQPPDVQGLVFRAGYGAQWQDEWRFAETAEDLVRMGGPQIDFGAPSEGSSTPMTTVKHGPVERTPIPTIVEPSFDTSGAEVVRDGIIATTPEAELPPLSLLPLDAGPTPVPTDRPPHIPPNLPSVQITPPPDFSSSVMKSFTPAPPVTWSANLPTGKAASMAAMKIVQAEARRDHNGNIGVYSLPSNDGGGTFEVAGINDRYHPGKASELAALIRAGKHQEAEQKASEYIIKYTDGTAKHFDNPGIQYLVRDIAFNRGPGGANATVRIALGMDPGKKQEAWKPLTQAEIAAAQTAARQNPEKFADRLVQARATYEYKYVGVRPNLDRGLRNRWSKSFANALELMEPPK